jgi:hypothetical protein
MRNIIYSISKRYDNLTKKKCKTYAEFKTQERIKQKFLNNVFKTDREEFLNTIHSALQRGRTKSTLANCFDSTGITYQQQIEQYFLYGWWYAEHISNNGDVYPVMECQCGTTRGCTNDTSLRYAKFLTGKYGKQLFVRPDVKSAA